MPVIILNKCLVNWLDLYFVMCLGSSVHYYYFFLWIAVCARWNRPERAHTHTREREKFVKWRRGNYWDAINFLSPIAARSRFLLFLVAFLLRFDFDEKKMNCTRNTQNQLRLKMMQQKRCMPKAHSHRIPKKSSPVQKKNESHTREEKNEKRSNGKISTTAFKIAE